MTAIDAKYAAFGGPSGSLGSPIGAEIVNPDGIGRRRQFQNGHIYYHPRLVYNDLDPTSGACVILNGPFWDKWSAHRWEQGVLGYPLTDEASTPDRRGRMMRFEFGFIVSTEAGGVHEVHGAIAEKWKMLSLGSGFLKYPLTDETETPDRRGRYNHFQGGSIYWTSATGAREVHGDIRARWQSLGWERSRLGYPITDETITPDRRGRYNHFEGGSIYWTPSTGAHEVTGPTRDRWKGLGWELSALGYPTRGEHSIGGRRVATSFEAGSIESEVHDVRLSYFAQNMALLPPPATYKGTERSRCVTALISFLRTESPDFVGLSEVFVDGERQVIFDALRDTFPYKLSGPDEEDLESDGGLLLLSRHPFLQSTKTIYRQCRGWDCIANKGAIHGRVGVPGHPTAYDIFLSHLQNPNEGGTDRAYRVVRQQLDHLNAFIASCRDVMSRPAILMGDMNVNALSSTKRLDRDTRLSSPVDLWLTCGDGTLGITDDVNSSFNGRVPARPVDDPGRHKEGGRIDHLLSWSGDRFYPKHEDFEVLVLQSSAGRDLSDHYGVRVVQSHLTEIEVDVRRPIEQVEVELIGFHCLSETGVGSSGSDEIKIKLGCKTAHGDWSYVKAPMISDIDSGDVHRYGRPRTLRVADPGDELLLSVAGSEVDDTSSNDPLKADILRVPRSLLLQSLGRSRELSMPLLEGDGGEYSVRVSLLAE